MFTEDGVERSLYQQRCANNQVDIGTWDVDRSLIIQADPRSYIGDSPQQVWAVKYNRWRIGADNGEEPPRTIPSGASGPLGTGHRRAGRPTNALP